MRKQAADGGGVGGGGGLGGPGMLKSSTLWMDDVHGLCNSYGKGGDSAPQNIYKRLVKIDQKKKKKKVIYRFIWFPVFYVD